MKSQRERGGKKAGQRKQNKLESSMSMMKVGETILF